MFYTCDLCTLYAYKGIIKLRISFYRLFSFPFICSVSGMGQKIDSSLISVQLPRIIYRVTSETEIIRIFFEK